MTPWETEDHRTCPETIDAAAYLLGALEDPERFRSHLRACHLCREEVEHLTPVVKGLATAVPRATPSPGVKNRLIAEIDSEAAILRAAGPEADRPVRSSSTRGRRIALAAAFAAIAAAALVAALRGPSGHPSRTVYAQVAPVAAGARGTLQQAGSHAELSVSRMPQPALGKIYEVWIARGGRPPQPTSALFTVTNAGNGSVSVPGSLKLASEVMVTSEPLGGSARPTGPPLLRFILPG